MKRALQGFMEGPRDFLGMKFSLFWLGQSSCRVAQPALRAFARRVGRGLVPLSELEGRGDRLGRKLCKCIS